MEKVLFHFQKLAKTIWFSRFEICAISNQALQPHINVLKQTSKFLFSTVKLKSSISVILPKWHVNLLKTSGKFSVKYVSFCDGDWQRTKQSYFWVLMEDSIRIIPQSSKTPLTLTAFFGILNWYQNNTTTMILSLQYRL